MPVFARQAMLYGKNDSVRSGQLLGNVANAIKTRAEVLEQFIIIEKEAFVLSVQ
jgi:hypothetical protein